MSQGEGGSAVVITSRGEGQRGLIMSRERGKGYDVTREGGGYDVTRGTTAQP